MFLWEVDCSKSEVSVRTEHRCMEGQSQTCAAEETGDKGCLDWQLERLGAFETGYNGILSRKLGNTGILHLTNVTFLRFLRENVSIGQESAKHSNVLFQRRLWFQVASQVGPAGAQAGSSLNFRLHLSREMKSHFHLGKQR